MTVCYIGIGSNLGDRRGYIERAIEELKKHKDMHIKRSSSIYETEAISDMPQCKYLNGVIEIETSLEPQALLKELNAIEARLGRVRTAKKNEPRTIDLDILYYGNDNIRVEGLEIPHPRIKEREFVLKGLRELGKV